VRNNWGGDPLSGIAATFYAFFRRIEYVDVNRKQFCNIFGVNAHTMTLKSGEIERQIYNHKFRDEYIKE